MSVWESRPLVELTSKIGSGATPRGGKGVYQDDGTSLIRSQNVYDLRFDYDGLAHISDHAAVALKGVTVKRADVLVNITGESVTRTCLVADAALPARVSQHVAIVRAKPRLLDPTYLLYTLINPSTKARLNTLSKAGATRRALTKGHLEALEIPVPQLEEQKRIAGVLGAFDDLIEKNRRLALQLDEVRAARVRAAIAESSFETRLSDVAAFVNGRNFTRGADGTGRPIIRTPEVRSGPAGNTVWSSVDADADRVANAGDILFVWSGTLMVNRWLYTEGLVNQHVFKIIPNAVPGWYVYALIEMQLSWFLGLAKDKATTMGHIQRGHLDEPMIGLDSATIERLSSAVEPVWSAALDLRLEVQDLARQRDELLPLLMSGEVRVRDVEAPVS